MAWHYVLLAVRVATAGARAPVARQALHPPPPAISRALLPAASQAQQQAAASQAQQETAGKRAAAGTFSIFSRLGRERRYRTWRRGAAESSRPPLFSHDTPPLEEAPTARATLDSLPPPPPPHPVHASLPSNPPASLSPARLVTQDWRAHVDRHRKALKEVSLDSPSLPSLKHQETQVTGLRSKYNAKPLRERIARKADVLLPVAVAALLLFAPRLYGRMSTGDSTNSRPWAIAELFFSYALLTASDHVKRRFRLACGSNLAVRQAMACAEAPAEAFSLGPLVSPRRVSRGLPSSTPSQKPLASSPSRQLPVRRAARIPSPTAPQPVPTTL